MAPTKAKNYASRAHLEQRFGVEEIRSLAEDPDNPGFDRTTRALDDAHAIVDSYLGVTYQLPVPNGTETRWPLLREISCDLARAELYDDASLEEPKKLMERAIKRLEMLRDGKLNLVSEYGDILPRRNVVVRAGPAPVMTREGLSGFGGGLFGGDCPQPSVAATDAGGSETGQTDLEPSQPGGGGSPGDTIALAVGWSADDTAEPAELTATSNGDTVAIPNGVGSLHLVVWRSDAAGGDPSEVHFAGGGNSRNLFGDAAPLVRGGIAGQAIVTVATQKTGLLSGVELRAA